MADKDLDALMTDLKKAAVSTVALSVAQLAVKKVTDQLASTIGAFDKQVITATKDVEDLTSKLDDLYGKLSPLGGALKTIADNLDAINRAAESGGGAVAQNAQAMSELGANSAAAAKGQNAVKEALKGAGDEAEKNKEKLKKVQDTAKELGTSMIDVVSALASGKEPMDVLKDKGAEMAKMLLKAKLDGVNLIETFKALGVATGILEVTTAGATAVQTTQAAASGQTAIKTEAATAATLEQAAANRLFAGGALANVAGQTAMTAAAGEATVAFETQAVAATEAAAAESVALAPIGVILAAIAVAAAGVAAVFAIAANDISGKVGDLTKDMGLTEEQMGRVKDKSVTMGDVAKATFEVLGKRLNAVFGPGLKAIGDGFMGLYRTISDVVVRSVAVAVGAFAGAFEAIRVSWSMLPAAMGDIIITGVNMVLDGVGKMVNGAIGLANGMIGTVNWLAKKLGLSLELPDLGQVQVTKLTNQFAGAAKAAGGAISGAFSKGFTGGFNGVMSIPGEIAGRAVEIAKDRIEEEAGKATDKIDQASAGCACGKDPETKVAETNAAAAKGRPESLQAYKPELPKESLKLAPYVDKDAIDEQVKALQALIKQHEAIGQLSTEVGKSLEAAFGKAGKAIADVFGHMNNLGKKLAEINLAQEKAKNDADESNDDPRAYDAQRFDARVQGYAAVSTAAKGFFEQNTAGYKALEVAEIAFNTLHTLNTIKAMALETTSAAHTATAQGAKQASYGVTAYAHALAELPFPFNLLAGAAVLAALVQVGVAIKGKPSGGGSVPGADDMKTRQVKQGSGSVLGDDKAKSESLEKALTHAQAYENKDLEYGNAMVRSLRSIDDQIGAVASALAKSFGAGGMLSTEGLNLGKTGTTASLSNFGFSKSTTRTLQDQGIQFDATTLGAIADGGLSGSTYQQVLETTKKKALFMPSSSKSKVITETGALDADFLTEVTGLIELLGEGVGKAAKAVGSTDFEALLANFKVDLGKLSFKDMTGAQIEEALNAIFGKLGDDMAKTAVPAIAQFQKVGEGAFETLVRVARQYEVIDTTLKSVGMTFGDVNATLGTVGVSSLAARERLVELVGGLDNLVDQTSFFAEHFLTEDERLAPVQKSVAVKLTELKLPTDMTREGFTALVKKQDLSTQAGAELYAELMKLAPAFDKVATAAENIRDKHTSIQDQIDELTMTPAQLLEKSRAKEIAATKALDSELGKFLQTLYDLQDAAKVDEKRTSIQDQIDELVMTPAQLLAKSRAAEMKAVEDLDASLVPFLKTLWDIQDAAEAAKVAMDRSNMYADLLEAQGRTEDAKNLRRTNALAQIKDPVQKDYQQRIWAAQDAAEKVSAARDVLTQAYQREQEAIQATKDKFKELSTSLRAFSAGLTDTIAGTDPGARYRRTRETFLSTAAMARLGDADAMGRLQNEGEAFTAASRDYVSTSLDYLRDVGLVREAVDQAADTADRQALIAEQQLEALNRSVQGLIEINASVVSVAQAIASLQAANQAAANAGVASVGGMPTGGVGKYGGLLTDHSSDASSSDGQFVEGDLYDYDFHVEMGRRLNAQMQANRDMGFDKWREKQEAVAAEGEAWLDSVWGGHPGAYREAMEPAGGIYDYNTPTWTERDYQAASGQLPFATGGGFEVGGSGPPDSKLFSLALSPGEAVNVRRRDTPADEPLITELRRLREELGDLRQTSARIATSNDKMERTLTNVTEGGRAMIMETPA